MDFSLTEDQQAVVDLTRKILTDRCAPEKLRQLESGTDWFDRDTWNELAKADILGLTLPEADGGGGYGYLETCLLLNEIGRAVAPLPLWSTLVGASAIATFGSDAQRAQWLPGVISGGTILALALSETNANERTPATLAIADGDGYVLHGAKTTVSAAHLAAAALVPARTEDGATLVLVVPLDADGVTLGRQDTFNHEPQFHLELDGVSVGADAVLGSPEQRGLVLDWVVDRATVGLCAQAAGVAEVGMILTAAYVVERKQFYKAIGTFQAVCHRMADCYVDAAAIWLSMLQAASVLDGAAADAPVDPKLIAVAKYWASYSGSRVGHADLHLHGGISIDLDYPIHRYFLWSKHLELQLGAGTPQLANLGALLAEEPVGAI